MQSTSDPEDHQSIERVVTEYILDVRVVAVETDDGTEYRFEAPDHQDVSFEDQELAELYADIYFDVNGFEEAGTGHRGIPPAIVQGGRDTMAAYLLTQYGDDDFVASFYGVTPGKVARYVEWVKERATEVRQKAQQQDLV